jgi:mRNA interferase MazF
VRRGELYRVAHPTSKDPKRFRIFCIVSRQVLIDSKYSTVICAPVYTAYDALATQVPLGVEDGVKHDSSIHCDNLISLQKSVLTNFIATLSVEKLMELDQALAIALDLPARLFS